MLVNITVAISPSFLTFAWCLHHTSCLNQIVLDKAHLLLTASHYQEQLGSVNVLWQLHCPFVCMSATLPPSAEQELCHILFLTSLQVLHAGSDWLNLQYSICSLTSEPPLPSACR